MLMETKMTATPITETDLIAETGLTIADFKRKVSRQRGGYVGLILNGRTYNAYRNPLGEIHQLQRVE